MRLCCVRALTLMGLVLGELLFLSCSFFNSLGRTHKLSELKQFERQDIFPVLSFYSLSSFHAGFERVTPNDDVLPVLMSVAVELL